MKHIPRSFLKLSFGILLSAAPLAAQAQVPLVENTEADRLILTEAKDFIW